MRDSNEKSYLASRIIPCLDVDKGRVVKGIKFVDIVDAGNPVEISRKYNEAGADELMFLDITASNEERAITLDIIYQIASEVFIPLTVGGGVRTLDDIRNLLLAGADKVSINSAAVADPNFVCKAADRFGSQCIVIAIDARQEPKKVNKSWEILTHGGRNSVDLDAISWANKMVACGAGEILLTSMDRDGTRKGFDLNLTRAVSDAVSIPVIASGGVGSINDFYAGIVEGHADAVLAASLFHFGEITIPEVKNFLHNKGITVRL